jgi:hypothetical protein
MTANSHDMTTGMVAGFSASEFTRHEFEAQEFVAMARRSVPLDELVKDLSAHLAQLKMNLVDAINQDYAAFVGMASSLKGLDKALSRVRTPVDALRTEVQQIRDAAAAAAEQVETKLEEREVLLKSERRLTLLLDVEIGIQKLELLLGESESLTASPKADNPENSKSASVLERIAHEFARLKGQVGRLEDDNNVNLRRELISRIEFIEEKLISKVNSLFAVSVRFSADNDGNVPQSAESVSRYATIESVMQSLLRVYYTLNRPDSCELTVRQFAVEPFLAHKLSIASLESGGAAGSCSGLPLIYEAVLNFIDEYCLPLTSIAASALDGDVEVESDLDDVYDMLKSSRPTTCRQSGLSRGWILTDPSFFIRCCVFPPLSAALLSLGGRRLTQYLDKGFQHKYNSTMEFLTKLEVRCASRNGALALRSHPSFMDFLQKWDLPLRAYFQLRFQEVTDLVGPLLTTPQMLTQVGTTCARCLPS